MWIKQNISVLSGSCIFLKLILSKAKQVFLFCLFCFFVLEWGTVEREGRSNFSNMYYTFIIFLDIHNPCAEKIFVMFHTNFCTVLSSSSYLTSCNPKWNYRSGKFLLLISILLLLHMYCNLRHRLKYHATDIFLTF